LSNPGEATTTERRTIVAETRILTREEERAIAALDAALELMNDSGAHWVQCTYKTQDPVDDNGRYGYCSLGAIHEVTGGWEGATEIRKNRPRHLAVTALADAYRPHGRRSSKVIDTITTWNDSSKTTWDDVKKRFARAKSRIRKGAL
jgi:hypothetical protein